MKSVGGGGFNPDGKIPFLEQSGVMEHRLPWSICSIKYDFFLVKQLTTPQTTDPSAERKSSLRRKTNATLEKK